MLKSILPEVVPKRRQVLIRQVMLPKKAGVGLQVAGASKEGGVEVAMEIVHGICSFLNNQKIIVIIHHNQWIINQNPSIKLLAFPQKSGWSSTPMSGARVSANEMWQVVTVTDFKNLEMLVTSTW